MKSHILGAHGAMNPKRAVSFTTRRFPRSLAEAFPDERASCIDVPRRPLSRMSRAAVWVAAALGVFALAVKFAVGA